MRHSKQRHQLNRFSAWRKATVASLVKNLLKYESIKTTLVRAKAAQPVVEGLIADAKADTLANKRKAYAVLGEHSLVSTLYKEIAPRFKDTNGGFTRILKAGPRRGDNAETAVFELTKKSEKKAKAKSEKAKKAEPVDEAAEAETAQAGQEKGHPEDAKAPKQFLGGIRKIFKKERDSL